MIVPLALGVSNAFLVKSKSNLLVDSGSQGNFKKLIRLLEKNQCPVNSLDYIFISHAHWDHCANVAALKNLNPDIKIIMHKADASYVKQGQNAAIRPFGWLGKCLALFFKIPYAAFSPDIIFSETLSLESLGINAYLMHTPGHTMGSASLIMENDKAAIVGDLIMGAPLLSHKPSYHFFIENYELNNLSLKDVISRNVNDFYVGHGGSLNIKDVFLQLGKKCFYH
jgi:hydroxyacylglutathione hydrolase